MVVVTAMKLLLGVLGLLLLLCLVPMLDSSVLIDSLGMIAVFYGVLELDILGILSKEEHVLGEDVDDCENVEHL